MACVIGRSDSDRPACTYTYKQIDEYVGKSVLLPSPSTWLIILSNRRLLYCNGNYGGFTFAVREDYLRFDLYMGLAITS